MCPWAGYLTAPDLNLLTSKTGMPIFIAGLMKIKEESTWYMETFILLFLHENPEVHRVRYCDYGYTTSKLRSRTSNAGLLALHLAFNTYFLPNAFHQLFAERK